MTPHTITDEEVQIWRDLQGEQIATDSNGCVPGVGHDNGTGYIQVRINGRLMYAHRLAYTSEFGPIPPKMQVDHVCHNRWCITAAHLRLATSSQNMQNVLGAKRTSTTGVRGVSADKPCRCWAGPARVHEGHCCMEPNTDGEPRTCHQDEGMELFKAAKA